jgi:hypothetical protein
VRTEGWAILSAVVLHGGLLAVAHRMPPPVFVTDADRIALQIIDIEIPTALPPELQPPPPPDQVTPEPRPEAERQPDLRMARVERAPGVAPRPSDTSNPETPPSPAPAPTQRGAQFDELPPDDGKGGFTLPPGIGGRPIYATPGVLLPDERPAPAPTVAPAPRQVPRDIATKVLNEALAANDKEKGIEPPVVGAIRTAAREAALSSDIPAGAKGVVTCNVSPSGVVSNCRVRSTAGADGSWAVVARAAGAVAGAALPGNYAKGAVVTIDISIVNAPPAGSKGGLSGAGANFDISNIGAHTTRNAKSSSHIAAMP